MMKNKQRTFIYCKCGNEMCSDGSFLSDTYDENNENHVKYKCKKCNRESDYTFDLAPVPINWKGLRVEKGFEAGPGRRPIKNGEQVDVKIPLIDRILRKLGFVHNPNNKQSTQEFPTCP